MARFLVIERNLAIIFLIKIGIGVLFVFSSSYKIFE